jgi:hypothetical protein
MILDHINPKLGKSRSGEGGAIHEGFGDILSALRYDDPEVSEDFLAIAGKPGSKTMGLRTVENALTLNQAGHEVHDRGQVYAGFFWSVKKRLPGASRQAADTALRLVFAHAYQYKTSKPSPADFVATVIAGAEALSASGKLGVDLNTVKTIINKEAAKRGMLDTKVQPVVPGVVFTSVKQAEKHFGPKGQTRFVLEQTGKHLGIEQRIYQQQYKTKRFGYVNVVEHGIIEHRLPNRKAPFISTNDARLIPLGQIDETIKIDGATALNLAMADANSILTGNRIQKVMLEASLKTGGLKTKADFEKLADVQMGHKMMTTAVNVLEYMKSRTVPPAELVILPDSNALHYKFNVGLGIYYINAKTGRAKFERDVFVN